MQAVETGVIDGAQCVTDSSPPGTRCLKPLQSLHIDSEEDFDSEYAEAPGPIPGFLRAVDTTMCVEMECSPQGEVLINGTPCNPGMKPPPHCPPRSSPPYPLQFLERINTAAICWSKRLS